MSADRPLQAAFAASLAAAATLSIIPTAGLAEPGQPDVKDVTPVAAEDLPDEPLEVGDLAPAFKLKNDKGEWVDSASLLERGPMVLSFYRGSWCPYCNGELRDIQNQIAPAAERLGATVLAIAPEAPQHAEELREKFHLTFDLLHDQDNRLAKRFGIAFTLDAKTVRLYEGYDIDVAESNQTGKHELPIPATYVIDTDGVIRYAYVNEDYKKRAKPKDVIKALEKVVKGDD